MKNILLGMAVGDALGVPYEFKSKDIMKLNPCTDMVGYGTHSQPSGTWSDDTSMALCIVDSLCNGLNYTDMANKFRYWLYDGLWTPHGKVFDNGISTKMAIDKWVGGEAIATECGGTDVGSNGNGSVMRTLALVPFIEVMDLDTRYRVVSNVSAITHGHWISKFSCFLVCEYAIALRDGFNKSQALDIAVRYLEEARDTEIAFGDLSHEEYNDVFGGLITGMLDGSVSDDDMLGSGYARDTALTSIWCIIRTTTFREAVLMAVNYGDDTDTTGCVTGGLAGILYGADGIPSSWVDGIVRKGDIIDLVEQYESTYETV